MTRLAVQFPETSRPRGGALARLARLAGLAFNWALGATLVVLILRMLEGGG